MDGYLNRLSGKGRVSTIYQISNLDKSVINFHHASVSAVGSMW